MDYQALSERSGSRPAAQAAVLSRVALDAQTGRDSGPPGPAFAGSTARAVLRESGLGRLRLMATTMFLLVLAGLFASSVLSGAADIKVLAWASLGLMLLLFAWMWQRIQREKPIHGRLMRSVAVPLCLSVVCANLAFGLVSSFCAAVTLGLLLFSSSTGRLTAHLAYATIAVGYAVCCAYVRSLAPSYQPLISARFFDALQRDVAMVTVELFYFAAHVSGRTMRRGQTRVVLEFERAVREAACREVLLREARDAFIKASGLGSPGRFTDHQLGDYRLGVVIGRGGMGEVYDAAHIETGQPAAVKILRVDALAEDEARRRFAREAHIAKSIESPHVVRVLAVSEADALFPYIAMERLRGVDLATYLRDQGRLSLREVTDLLEQLSRGLSAAHRMQVVHRDLKPNNVFREMLPLGGQVQWKILDFGVSKLLGSADACITATGWVGTPQYMAPEQVRGEAELDLRTDVYGLAAIAYRALTGEAPFAGDVSVVLHAVAERMPLSPSSLVNVHPDLDLVLALGLAKRREQRFASARELARAFLCAVRGELPEGLRKRARGLLATHPYAA